MGRIVTDTRGLVDVLVAELVEKTLAEKPLAAFRSKTGGDSSPPAPTISADRLRSALFEVQQRCVGHASESP